MSGLTGQFLGQIGGFALDASLTLPPTGLTALIGPSGSGKTTLLRCIAGLTRLPGRLTVDGEVWQDENSFLPPHRRAIGMVFQDAGLLPHLSVERNLVFGLSRTRAPVIVARDEVVSLLGLAPLLSRSTANLSGGERQRVAIGRALLSQPRLLLMDEPLSSLDAEAKAQIAPYIERLHRTLALPVLYVTHDAGEVRRLADQVLVMRDGAVRLAPEATAGAPDLDSRAPEEIRRLARAALSAGL